MSIRAGLRPIVHALPPLLLLALLLQAVFVLHFLTPDALLSGEPIVTEDYPLHYYNILRFRDALLHGRLHYYDPYFALGYGGALWEMVRGQDVVFLAVLFFWVSPLALLKLYLLASNLAVPLLAYHASATVGFGRRAASLAALLSALSWQFVGAIHHMLYSGVFSFVLGSYVAVLAAAHAFAYATEGRRRNLLLFLASALLSFAMHRLSLPLIALFVMAIALATGRRRALILCAVVLAALAALLLAYRSAIAFQISAFDAPFFHQSAGLTTLVDDVTTEPVQAWMLIAGLAGIALARKERTLFRWASVSFLFLLIGVYFWSSFPLARHLQPQRMLVPLAIFSALFAGRALSSLRLSLRWKASAALALALLAAVALLPVRHVGADIKEEWGRQLSTAVPQDTENLILWLRDSTAFGDRILVENSGYRSGFVFGGHTLPLIVLSTGRELVGLPYPYPQVKEGSLTTDFSEGLLFNRDCGSFTTEDLAGLLNLFDVRWIVGWSEGGLSCLRNHASLLVVTEKVGRFSIFEVNQSSQRFLAGNGTVAAGYDRISLANISEGRIVLKYRYAPWLAAGEGVILEESYVGAGAATRGFLSIEVSPRTTASDITT